MSSRFNLAYVNSSGITKDLVNEDMSFPSGSVNNKKNTNLKDFKQHLNREEIIPKSLMYVNFNGSTVTSKTTVVNSSDLKILS